MTEEEQNLLDSIGEETREIKLEMEEMAQVLLEQEDPCADGQAHNKTIRSKFS